MKFRKQKDLFRILKIFAICVITIGIGAYASFSYFKMQESQKIAQETKIVNDKKIEEDKKVSELLAKIEAKKKEPVYVTLPGATKFESIRTDFSQVDSIWKIVSKTSPISVDYAPAPILIPNVATMTSKSTIERSVRSDIEAPLITMFEAAKKDGYDLMIGSGYRPASMQKTIYDNLVSSIGEEEANKYVAKPGQSEHQTGLAVDLTTVSGECFIDECFANTSAGKWLADNSYKYGFILRYSKGKEDITGYNYEPWHFRYVGINLATALYESNLTLDEASSYLDSALQTLKDNGAIQ